MELQIVRVTPGDFHTLRQLGIETFTESFSSHNTPENMEAYIEKAFNEEALRAELLNPGSSFYFCKASSELIGYMKLNFAPAQTDIKDERSLEIERIYVREKYQRKQAGLFMLKNAIKIAEQTTKEYLWLGVWEQNVKALRFYEKNGFVAFSKHHFMLGWDRQTDIIMKLVLRSR